MQLRRLMPLHSQCRRLLRGIPLWSLRGLASICSSPGQSVRKRAPSCTAGSASGHACAHRLTAALAVAGGVHTSNVTPHALSSNGCAIPAGYAIPSRQTFPTSLLSARNLHTCHLHRQRWVRSRTWAKVSGLRLYSYREYGTIAGAQSLRG